MRCIALLHLEHLFAGARMFTRLLWRNGRSVGRKHVATLRVAEILSQIVPEILPIPA